MIWFTGTTLYRHVVDNTSTVESRCVFSFTVLYIFINKIHEGLLFNGIILHIAVYNTDHEFYTFRKQTE